MGPEALQPSVSPTATSGQATEEQGAEERPQHHKSCQKLLEWERVSLEAGPRETVNN